MRARGSRYRRESRSPDVSGGLTIVVRGNTDRAGWVGIDGGEATRLGHGILPNARRLHVYRDAIENASPRWLAARCQAAPVRPLGAWPRSNGSARSARVCSSADCMRCLVGRRGIAVCLALSLPRPFRRGTLRHRSGWFWSRRWATVRSSRRLPSVRRSHVGPSRNLTGLCDGHSDRDHGRRRSARPCRVRPAFRRASTHPRVDGGRDAV